MKKGRKMAKRDKLDFHCCKECGQFTFENKYLTIRELQMRLGKLLGLEPRGISVEGSPYYDLNSKAGLCRVLEKVTLLKRRR